MRLTINLLAVFALAFSSFGQEKQEKQEKRVGMVWFWFDGAKKCNVEWDTAAAEREKAFISLVERVKDGDNNKIYLYMSKVGDAQHKISMAWACGSDYSRNLEKNAGDALNNRGGIFSVGQMTEAEYDEAMALVKTLRKKIESRSVTAVQQKAWDDAMKATGANPDIHKLSK